MTTRIDRPAVLAAAGALAMMLTAVAVAEIPPRPEQIDFPPLEFEPPDAADYRHVLSNGVPVYLAPDRALPLVDITFTFRGGGYLEPADRLGLASATGAMMRRGGTTTVPPEEMDEQFDFLAADAGSFSGDTMSGASLNSLSANLDESFALFMDMVRNPGFDEDRLGIYKQEVLEQMKQRNDNAGAILAREWNALMYGREHFEARVPTETHIADMTTDDLRSMHARLFHPGNLIIAVTGDFDEQDMLSRLETALSGWEAGPSAGDPPAPVAEAEPGMYYVEKDIPQGKVRIGLRSIERDHPDYFPMLVMNDILGGGGFTSRITKRVRSDEGLAYSARSRLNMGVWYPGELVASFESKNRTVALATKIVLEEFEKMRTELVSDEELTTAQQSFIETFPRTFESKSGMLNVFVRDEMTDRPDGYWQTYREHVRAVTPEAIREVARRHLTPEKVRILVVGTWEEIYAGDLEGRATMSAFFDGTADELPLRDPLTQKPME